MSWSSCTPGVRAAAAGGPAPRRHWYLMAVASLSAAACLAIGAVVIGRDDPRPDPTDIASGPPADDAIVVMESELATRWFDEATGAWRMRLRGLPDRGRYAGQGAGAAMDVEEALRIVEKPDGSRVGLVTVIDHVRREYYVLDDVGVAAELAAWRLDAALKAEVEAGGLTADGHVVVDGERLERYVPPGGVPQRELWVDPATGHTLKTTEAEVTTTFTYLPRTPENLALVEAEVPEGYGKAEGDYLGRFALSLWPPSPRLMNGRLDEAVPATPPDE